MIVSSFIGWRRLRLNAVVGAGWFWTPFKCSTHRRSRSSRVGSVLPFPSLIGAPLPDGELVSSQTNARIASISSFWCLGPFLIDLLAVSFTCVPCNRAEIILSETGHQQSSLYILECIKKSRKLLYHVLASYLMHGMSSNNSVAKFNILNCIFTRSTTHLKLRLYAIMHFSICNSIFVCFSKVW